jgi:hypothetical protein
LEKIQKFLKDNEGHAGKVRQKLDRLRRSPKFLGKEFEIKAAQKTFHDLELRQWDLATTIQGHQDDPFWPKSHQNIMGDEFPTTASLKSQIRKISFGDSIEQLTEPLKKLKKQAGPVEEQFNNVALAYRDQTKQIQSLLPAMKQAGAGMKGMEGMLTSFASKSGPALENFLGGKGGGVKELFASFRETAIDSFAAAGRSFLTGGLRDLVRGKGGLTDSLTRLFGSTDTAPAARAA